MLDVLHCSMLELRVTVIGNWGGNQRKRALGYGQRVLAHSGI